jgi:hypothetical protein
MEPQGKPKRKVRDLSRLDPTSEEVDAIIETFGNGPPLVTAILGQALLELELDRMLRKKFGCKDDQSTWDSLTADNGPLGTFNAKIVCAYAFKLFGESTKDHLNRIRNIRNAFAHAKIPLTFENPLVLKDIRAAKLPPAKRSPLYGIVQQARSHKTTGMAAFIALVTAVFIVLSKRQIRSSQATSRNYRRAVTRQREPSYRSALFNALRAYQPPESQASPPGLPPLHRSGEPGAFEFFDEATKPRRPPIFLQQTPAR